MIMLLSLHPSPALACSASTSHLHSLFSTIYNTLKVNLPLITEQAGSISALQTRSAILLKWGLLLCSLTCVASFVLFLKLLISVNDILNKTESTSNVLLRVAGDLNSRIY